MEKQKCIQNALIFAIVQLLHFVQKDVKKMHSKRIDFRESAIITSRSEGRLQGFFDDFCVILKVRELNTFNFLSKS